MEQDIFDVRSTLERESRISYFTECIKMLRDGKFKPSSAKSAMNEISNFVQTGQISLEDLNISEGDYKDLRVKVEKDFPRPLEEYQEEDWTS